MISLARATAVAAYAPSSPLNEGQRTIRTGTITVAALRPAKPVPIPAPREASTYHRYSLIQEIYGPVSVQATCFFLFCCRNFIK